LAAGEWVVLSPGGLRSGQAVIESGAQTTTPRTNATGESSR
jgi:hypothetical protein